MSNPAKAKLRTPRRASWTMPKDWHTIGPNFDISSHTGFLNAIDHLRSSTMRRFSVSSKCSTQKSKHHQPQRLCETSRKSMAFLKSMLGRYFRFVPLISFPKSNATNLARSLKQYPGHIHIGFDGWTSLNVISFLGVVIHTAREGLLQSFLLDFITYVLLVMLAGMAIHIQLMQPQAKPFRRIPCYQAWQVSSRIQDQQKGLEDMFSLANNSILTLLFHRSLDRCAIMPWTTIQCYHHWKYSILTPPAVCIPASVVFAISSISLLR